MQHKDPQSRLPDPSSDLTPQSEENARKVPPKPSYEAAYGHLRNGQIYPDPFPYDPPSPEESDSLNLTPPQRIALEHILLGSQLSVAARVAGVTRMTLYRWFRHDPNFQAAYNTWQTDAMINTRTRIVAMTNSATTTVEAAVQTNPHVALAVQKATGVLKHTTLGPTEPEECKQQIEQNQHRAQPGHPSNIICASVSEFGVALQEPPARDRPSDQTPAPDPKTSTLIAQVQRNGPTA